MPSVDCILDVELAAYTGMPLADLEKAATVGKVQTYRIRGLNATFYVFGQADELFHKYQWSGLGGKPKVRKPSAPQAATPKPAPPKRAAPKPAAPKPTPRPVQSTPIAEDPAPPPRGRRNKGKPAARVDGTAEADVAVLVDAAQLAIEMPAENVQQPPQRPLPSNVTPLRKRNNGRINGMVFSDRK